MEERKHGPAVYLSTSKESEWFFHGSRNREDGWSLLMEAEWNESQWKKARDLVLREDIQTEKKNIGYNGTNQQKSLICHPKFKKKSP